MVPTSSVDRLLCCVLVSSLALLLGVSHASAQQTQASGDLVKRLDPTDFRTRFETRNEYQSLQEGGFRNLLMPRLDYAFSKTFRMRIEAPFTSVSATGDPAKAGFGDLTIGGAFRALRGEGYALVAGSEVILNTATDRLLGTGKNQIAPFAFASFDVPKLNSTFFPGIQHYQSVSGDADRRAVSFTQLRFFILTRWPNRFYTGIENQITIDHERNGRVGYTIETEVGRFMDKHIALWARPGVGLLGDGLPQVYNWNMEVGFRYLFD